MRYNLGKDGVCNGGLEGEAEQVVQKTLQGKTPGLHQQQRYE